MADSPAPLLAGMRQPRIKVDPEVDQAAYHCVSRTVNKERLFDDVAREILRRQIWLVAEYCGLRVLGYSILTNHFHVLPLVPQHETVSDEELLRRHQLLYPKLKRRQAVKLELIKAQLATNGPAAIAWRRQQRKLMGDISQYMKLVKQRFSIWFNKSRGRIGPVWNERFKSVLVESTGSALRNMAAYIDLNLVRAGLTDDPKDGRFCCYAEAVAGNEQARQAIMTVLGMTDWNEAQEAYRQLLYGVGTEARERKQSISDEDFERVMKEGGEIPLAEVLRCRVRYFTDGMVLGSKAFVAEQLAAYRARTGLRRRSEPHELPALAEWGELATLRRPRRNPLG